MVQDVLRRREEISWRNPKSKRCKVILLIYSSFYLSKINFILFLFYFILFFRDNALIAHQTQYKNELENYRIYYEDKINGEKNKVL